MIFKKNNKLSLAVFTALTAQGFVGISSTQAQQQPRLQEILITADRRETNVQNVPMAVTALSGENLQDQNIENLEDLTATVPNVLVRGGPGGTSNASVTMRGLPGVGLYVDGIWQVANTGFLEKPFLDLQRVEVLRGPQGTLYGRDSTGGSIHFYTELPQDEFGASVNFGVGSFKRRDVSATVDIPITNTIQTKWSVASYDRDGFIHSQVTGQNDGGFEDQIVRGDVLWTPTDRLQMRLIYQEDDILRHDAKSMSRIEPGMAWAGGVQVGISQMYDIASGGRFNNETATTSGSLGDFENRNGQYLPRKQNIEQITYHLDYRLSDIIDVKYMFGRIDVTNDGWTDFAGIEWPLFIDYGVSHSELDSHEIQFSGDHGRLRWNAGVYSWDENNAGRGNEFSASAWVGATPHEGVPKDLNYADVLASPACQASPADRGYDFGGDATDPATWPVPCDGFFGNGQLDLLALFVSAGDEASGGAESGEAYFGEINFDITNAWDVTVGYRYHEQDVQEWDYDVAGAIAMGLTQSTVDILGERYASVDRALNLPIISDTLADPARSSTFDNTSVRFASSYDINDDVMVYVGYTEGFNSGGTSVYSDSLGRVVLPYSPETIENWEIGMRGDFLANRLRVNATYFNTAWKDIQFTGEVIDRATGQATTTVVTQNAAEGEAKGVDLEITYALMDNLTLGANLGFLDTEYVSSIAGAAIGPGSRFGGAPDETYNFSAEYEWLLPGGATLLMRGNYNYTGAYERSAIPNFNLSFYDPVLAGDGLGGDFWMANARMVYTPAQGNYEVSVFGNNLTNELNRNSGFMHPLWNMDFGTIDKPREIGVNVSMSF